MEWTADDKTIVILTFQDLTQDCLTRMEKLAGTWITEDSDLFGS